MRLQRLMVAALERHLKGGKPRAPLAGVLLWRCFSDLCQSRSWNASGPNPISQADLLAWCQTHGLPLLSHHLDVVLAMDRAWIAHAIAAPKVEGVGDPAVKRLPQVSAQPLTAALFDATFG